MIRALLLMAAAAILCQTANAECITVEQSAPPFPRARFSVDNLNGAFSDGRLALWPGTDKVKISPEFGLYVTFDNGTTCHAVLSGKITHGIKIASGTRRIQEIEAGVCEDQERTCTSVILNLGR